MAIPAQPKLQAAVGLPPDEKTIGDRLKALGYKTAWIGGWPLGSGTDFHPLARGFDEFFGFFGAARTYFPRKLPARAAGLFRGQSPVVESAYLTDALGREAADFIERQKERPFFLCVHFNAVGAPLQPPGDAAKQFPNIQNKRRQAYAAMLASLDDNVGRVLDKLAALGLGDQTLVVFTSGNGGATRLNASSNAPLRGSKGQLAEGGIRVPFFVRWKDRITVGKTHDQPVSALDMLPTVVAAAGAEISPGWKLDGANLLPLATGKENAAPHERLFWRLGAQGAVRKGDWKLVRDGRGNAKLFNLKDDIGETRNLADEEIGTARDLNAAFDEWSAGLREPLWGVKPAKPAAEKKPRPPRKPEAKAEATPTPAPTPTSSPVPTSTPTPQDDGPPVTSVHPVEL
jgi:arylsulfatase A-like enzyme